MKGSKTGGAAGKTLLQLNTYHYRRGGSDVVFLEQAALFEAAGWRAVPFCMRHPQNEPSPWSRYWVDEIEFGSEYSRTEKVVAATRVVWSRQARRRLERLLEAVRPDVAHVHAVYHHISPSVLSLLAERGVPTVLTTHDLKLACPAYKMLTHDGICERCRGGRFQEVVRNRCIKDSRALSSLIAVEAAVHGALRSYDHVDRLISPSRFYIDKFVEWGFDRDRFVHVPNFVDAAAYEADSEPGRDFVYFGRLAEEKGLDTLVRASAASGVPVRIVGTGPEEGALVELARRLAAPVEFEGYRSGAELHRSVRSARAVVLPSEWYENGPVSVLEAYALGTPVIGARIGGIPELIREGETGMSFASGSVDALAEVMTTMSELPDHDVGEMGVAGRQWVEADFGPDHYRERVLAVYADLGVSY